MPATKQEAAARALNTAADKQLRARELMNGGGPSHVAGITIDGQESTKAATRYLQQFLRVGGAGYGGYQGSYGIGAATQNQTAGAIGGAVSGAALSTSHPGAVARQVISSP